MTIKRKFKKNKHKQTHLESAVEAALNTATGLVIAIGATQMGSLLGFWDISFHSNILLSSFLTLMSVIRSYAWRRIFSSDWWYNKVSIPLVNFQKSLLEKE